ncbi:hypothetical protein NPIL_514021 [Nephila pilipes]|uniref:Uncharacterized protein n=1 Tax=Nephila pilipes TaxID=299642 RepID=A0A8X6NY60_NEPPI|nr:hypothetical protein NPIL_514021 [Nephila pilipes]
MEDDDDGNETFVCKSFESTLHQMFGRRKEKMNEYVGFYNCVFEKPDWWWCDDPLEFTVASDLGKDVYGIVQSYLKGRLALVSRRLSNILQKK